MFNPISLILGSNSNRLSIVNSFTLSCNTTATSNTPLINSITTANPITTNRYTSKDALITTVTNKTIAQMYDLNPTLENNISMITNIGTISETSTVTETIGTIS